MPEAPPAPVKEVGFIERMMSHASQPGVPVPAPVIPPPVTPPPAPASVTPPPAKPAAVEPLSLPDFAPAPAPAAKADIDDEPATSPRAKDWKAIKAERDSIRAERDELQRKYLELQSKSPTTDQSSEIEKLKKERDYFDSLLRDVAYEKNPKFVEGRKAIIESATRNIGDGSSKIGELLSLPSSPERNRMLNEMISGMTPMEQSVVGAAAVELEKITRSQRDEISKYTLDQEANQRNQQQQAEARKQEHEKLFNSVLERASALPVFQTREGDAEWNRGVENRRAVARNIAMGNIGPEGVFKAATWAAAAPALLEDLNAARASEVELRARIRQLEVASPTIKPTDHQKIEAGGGKQLSYAESVMSKTFNR